MSFVQAVLKGPPIGVAVVEKPEELSVFLKPSCAAVIWGKRQEPNLQVWLDKLDPVLLSQGHVVSRPEATRRIVSELCDAAGTPLCAQRDMLINDVASLATSFASLMQTPYVRLRLAVVTTNSCRKFHMDAISGRLVCTYRGLGTQYGISQNGGDPTRVFTVPTGAPILLRGSLWPAEPSSGLLHRSPPIEGTGVSRLVLVLDPLDNFEEEL